MRYPKLIIELAVVLSCLLSGYFLPAQDAETAPVRKSSEATLPLAELEPDRKIPILKQVVGHAWGEEVSSHGEVERYIKDLARAAPFRSSLKKYGTSYEGRPLYYLAISSAANIERLEEIRENNILLSDPRRGTEAEVEKLFKEHPAIVWLSYSVHGDESSGTDAGLLTAYHLLADLRKETRELLEKLVVIIDPLQNPDGRDRFVNFHRENRGVAPSPEPLASEHAQRWPGGRFNHYLFDLNRDWYLQSQVEAGRKALAFSRWQPQVFVDAHEMGRNSTYFFPPATDPINRWILPVQKDWFERIGKYQAGVFDFYGFSYSTREMFDLFYPGYGDSWPTLQGSLGILWEQAGVRGLVVARDDERLLRYSSAVRNHYVSGIATLESVFENREALLRDHRRVREDAASLMRKSGQRDYFILESGSPQRAARLVRLLQRNSIEVHRVREPLFVQARRMLEGTAGEVAVPIGSYHVPLEQPAGRLARTLLDRHTDMGKDFIERQLTRHLNRLDDEIYDVTAWSLPLAWGTECLAAEGEVKVVSDPVKLGAEQDAYRFNPVAGGEVRGGGLAKVAYLVRGDADELPGVLSDLLNAGVRVHVSDEPLVLGGIPFPRGSLVIRINENDSTVHARVRLLSKTEGVVFYPTDTALVDKGAQLGGPNVRWVKPPKVLLLMDRPASYSVGHTWFYFDRLLRYPVTRVTFSNLGGLDLSSFNVLILPHGKYDSPLAPDEKMVRKLKEWVRSGGTLLLMKAAAAWACGEKVGLLGSRQVRIRGTEESAAGQKDAGKKDGGKGAEGRLPPPVPGAFFEATTFQHHWGTFGFGPRLRLFFNGRTMLEPLKNDVGRNLVNFSREEDYLISGFCWPDSMDMLRGKPYMASQELGSGHVIAFADDPNFRAMCRFQQRLFFNAVFFGPGH